MVLAKLPFCTLSELLSNQAQKKPEQLFFRYLLEGEINGPIQEWSYERLDRAARTIGRRLTERTSQGERVLLLYPPGPDFIAGFFGCLYAGVVAVPVYPPDPARLQRTLPRVERIIQDSQANLVLSTQEIYELAGPLAELSSSFASLRWLATDTLPDDSNGWSAPSLSGEDLAFLQYTSGSTGDPKGVMVSHQNLLHNSALIAKGFRHDEGLRGVIWLPSYHDMGLIGGVIQPMYVGGSVTLFSPLDFLKKPLRWLKAVSHFRATTSGGPDFAYRLCVRKISDEEKEGLDLSSWNVAFSGAEPVRADTLQAFADKFSSCGFRKEAFLPVYGLAESTLIVTCPEAGGWRVASLSKKELSAGHAIAPSPDEETSHLVACGVPLPELNVQIINSENGQACTGSQIGEIWVSGPSVAHGYWGNEEASKKSFGAKLQPNDTTTYLRTGDLGFLWNGELLITGRSKDLIIIRGKNYYPQDIEHTVQEAHPAIRPGCVAVFGLEWHGEERVALATEVDPKKGGGDGKAVVDAIREALAVEHQLSVVTILLLEPGMLPKTSSGKVQRYACRDGVLDGSLVAIFRWSEDEQVIENRATPISATPSNAPQSETAEKIKNCTAKYLKVPTKEVNASASFSSMGLDSVGMLELTVALEEVLSRPLPTMTLYNYPSIAALANHLEGVNHLNGEAAPIALTTEETSAYVNLDNTRARIDRRNTNYQFDLERDVAWSRIKEPGEFLPPLMLQELGVDVENLRKHPEAWELFQWAMAVGACQIFELLEVVIVLFCEREAKTLGNSRSVKLLCEEEDKHIQLFRRYAKHLKALRPNEAKRLQALSQDTERYCLNSLRGLPIEDKASFHYLTWLWTLFFEEYTVYFHERLAAANVPIQPAWLTAHAAHRREEMQHIATDVRHLEAVNVSPKERYRQSAIFAKNILENFHYQFSLDGPCRLLKEIFPNVRVLQDDPYIAAKCLKELFSQRVFSHIAHEAPFFKELSKMAPEEALPKANKIQATKSEAQQTTPTASQEPLAIVGAACRLPGADTPEKFWQLLLRGDDMVTEIPKERFDVGKWFDPNPNASGKMYTKWGGFVDKLAEFDPAYFGIMPREAKSMDPQQRMLLETTWDALEDASILPQSLFGTQTGVFIGICSTDYNHMANSRNITPWSATGSAFSVAAGRISYLLGVKGPSLAIDTACSSSLVALHVACQSLRSRESNVAIVGGSNVLLIPEGHLAFSALRAMSPTGRCKAFDESADGYVRSEGCVTIVVKRLSDALKDGDSIWAIIRGTATNQDGRSNGLTAPHGPAQEEVIHTALSNAGLTPDDVGYVEAHGTGTPIGDPIELSALGNTFGLRQKPLWVGSSKTNIGHTEGASGLVGVLKAAMVLRNGVIPPHLHFTKPTSHFDWSKSSLQVPTQVTSWSDERRIAGINSFGFGGSNAHAVLESPPPSPAKNEEIKPAQPYLLLSARTEAGLRSLAGKFAEQLPQVDIVDACYTSSIGRTSYRNRLAIPASSKEVSSSLLAFSRGEEVSEALLGTAEDAPKVAFLYTGQGAQYSGMAKALYTRWSVFREAIDKCAAHLSGELDRSLQSLLFDANSPINETCYTQPALVSVGVALTELWRSFGVEPVAFLGHSIGEITAAWASGVFSLEDAMRFTAARGRLMSSMPRGGAMFSLETDEATALKAIEPFTEKVSLAAVNAARQVVLSGEATTLEKIVDGLTKIGIRAKQLTVSHAFHSPMMDPILDELEDVVKGLQRKNPQKTLLSNLSGRVAGIEVTRPGYWSMHVRAPVRFADGLASLLSKGVDTLIELGPQAHLLGLAAERPEKILRLPSMRKNSDEETLFGSAAKLWTAGGNLNWAALWEPFSQRKISLPTQPYEKQHYWHDEAPQSTGQPTGNLWLGERLDTAGRDTFETSLSVERFPWLGDHKVDGAVVVPGAGWIELMRAASVASGQSGSLKNISLERPLLIQGNERYRVQSVVDRESGNVELFSHNGTSWQRVARGSLHEARPLPSFSSELIERCSQELATNTLYEGLNSAGLDYGPAFASISRLRIGDGVAFAEISLPGTITDAANFPCHPALLDAALQACAGLLSSEPGMWLPVAIDGFSVQATEGDKWQAQVTLRSKERDERIADILLFDAKGRPVAEVLGLHLRKIARRAARTSQEPRDIYTIDWVRSEPANAALPKGSLWIVGESEIARSIVAALPNEARLLSASQVEEQEVAAETILDLTALDSKVPLQTGAIPRLQRWLRGGHTRRLILVTCGAQVFLGDQIEATEAIAQAALWGLGRTLAQEHPELGCRLVDLDPRASIEDCTKALRQELAEPTQEQSAWRSGQRQVARLVVAPRAGLPTPSASPWRLVVGKKGVLDALQFDTLPTREVGPHEVEIAIEAAGLNFRDVLNALGMYPGEAGPLGGECAGRIISVGSKVTGLQVGDPVVALAAGTFGDSVITDARVVAKRPESLGAIEAATIPITFLTAWYALFDLAQLKAGQKILIHAAAGGVGMAAVQLARRIGAEVLATASPSKYEAVRTLGVTHLYHSRNTDFSREIEQKFGPIDAVLNALTGPFIPASMRLLKEGGYFLEMGKAELWDKDKLTTYPKINYHPFDLVEVNPERIGEMLREVMRLMEAGELQPLPRRVFALSNAQEAFRFMAQAKHVGKVVLAPKLLLDPQARYVITGAFGGLGKRLLDWFVEQGARNLLLIGRSAPTQEAQAMLSEFSSRGVNVEFEQIDLTSNDTPQKLKALIETSKRPVRGVVHTAGIIDDGLFSTQSQSRFSKVSAAKLGGALSLHEATQHQPLDFFTLFSSIAGVMGSAGQSNYAAANAGLDALAAIRRANGLAATSIAWGPWAGDGMLASLGEAHKQRMSAQGLPPMEPMLGMRYFEQSLLDERPDLLIARLDLAKMSALLQTAPPFLTLLLKPSTASAPSKGANGLRGALDKIKALPQTDRQAALTKELQAATAKVMGLPKDLLEAKRPLRDLGLDSLIGVELQGALSQAVGTTLPRTLLLDHPTLDALSTYLCKEFLTPKEEVSAEPESQLALEIAELEKLL